MTGTKIKNTKATFEGKARFDISDNLTIETPQDGIYRAQLKPEPADTEIRTSNDISLETPQDVIYREEFEQTQSTKSAPEDHVWIDPSIAKQSIETAAQAKTRLKPKNKDVSERQIGATISETIHPAAEKKTDAKTIKIGDTISEWISPDAENKPGHTKIQTVYAEDQNKLDALNERFNTSQKAANSKEQANPAAKLTRGEATHAIDAKVDSMSHPVTVITGMLGLVPKGAEDLEVEGKFNARADKPLIIQQISTDTAPHAPLLSAEEEGELFSGNGKLNLSDNPFEDYHDTLDQS